MCYHFSEYLGDAYKGMGNLEAALQVYREAARLSQVGNEESISRQLRLKLADVLYDGGKIDMAVSLIQSVVKENEEETDTLVINHELYFCFFFFFSFSFVFFLLSFFLFVFLVIKLVFDIY